jgi:hypothetical protein
MGGLYFDQQGEETRRFVPALRTAAANSSSGGSDGNSAGPIGPLIVPFASGWGTGSTADPSQQLLRFRLYKSPTSGDVGNEGVYYGGPLIGATGPFWQWQAQEWQPPRFRYAQRMAALLAPNADLNNTLSAIRTPFVEGWQNQAVQPPARFWANRAMMSAALARGDDGITAIFVPPWTVAPRAISFPDVQSDPRAATPTYLAGPQVGAFKTLPNITSPQVLKSAPGSVIGISVITAGSTAGGVYDTPTLGGASAATQIWPIPMTAGYYELQWPCQQGIVIVPGTGQVVAAKWT